MTPEPWLFLHNGLGRWAVIVAVGLSFLHACLEMKYPLLLHLIVPPDPFHYFAHPIIHSIHPNQLQASRLSSSLLSTAHEHTHS